MRSPSSSLSKRPSQFTLWMSGYVNGVGMVWKGARQETRRPESTETVQEPNEEKTGKGGEYF